MKLELKVKKYEIKAQVKKYRIDTKLYGATTKWGNMKGDIEDQEDLVEYIGEREDKFYQQAFSGVSSVTVNHNLGKYPSVRVVDSGGTEYEVKIVHNSLNQLVASWNTNFTGKIFCN